MPNPSQTVLFLLSDEQGFRWVSHSDDGHAERVCTPALDPPKPRD